MCNTLELLEAYASHELVCELSGTPPDMPELDKAIWRGDSPLTGFTEEGEKYPSVFLFTRDDRIKIVKAKNE